MSTLQQFDPIKANLAIFVAPIKQIAVLDDQSMKSALEVAKESKAYAKKIEEIRTTLVKPLNDRVKEINSYAKSLQAPLDEAESHLKSELRKYEMALEKIRAEEFKKAEAARLEALKKAEQERKAKEEAAKKEAELDSLFGEAKSTSSIELESKIDEEIVNAQIKAEHKASVKNIESQKVKGASRVWIFEITDSNLVPRDFLMVDERKIRAAVAEGAREIAGVKIFEETKIAIR